MSVKLKVGETYLNRKGEEIKIIGFSGDSKAHQRLSPFSSPHYWDLSYRSYLPNGSYLRGDVPTDRDLVKKLNSLVFVLIAFPPQTEEIRVIGVYLTKEKAEEKINQLYTIFQGVGLRLGTKFEVTSEDYRKRFAILQQMVKE